MSEDTYNTISDISHGLYKDRGSKFLAFAYPVDNEILVKKHIATLKKEFHDARHHCYAYRIGTVEPFRFRMNDDGEPSGTAGKPIYGQILSKQVTNVLIVVVRYFGGTLLGTSGLIQAYRAAAEDALNNAEIEQKVMRVRLRLHFSYNKINTVMKIIKNESIEVIRQDFQEECEMEVYVRRKLKDLMEKRFSLIEGLTITKI